LQEPYRKCGFQREDIKHVTSGYNILASREYRTVHDNTTEEFHQKFLLKKNHNKYSSSMINIRIHSKVGKGKAIPLQALTDLEGSRRLRLLDFKTIST
jgi:hypothetical protein